MTKTLLQDLDTEQRDKLADLARIPRGTMRQYASGWRTPSADAALRIRKAALRMKLIIPQSTLATACANCEYAKRCEKQQKGSK